MTTRMSCRRAEKLMPLYAAGDLPAGRRARAVAAHVAGCASCAALSEGYGASREWARAAGDVPEFGEEFYEQLRAGVLDRVNRDTRPAAPSRIASFFPAMFAGRRLAYAASLALAACALAFALYLGRDGAGRPRGDEVAGTTSTDKVITPPPPPPAHAGPTPDAGEQRPTPAAPPGGRQTAQPKPKTAGGGFKRTPTLRHTPPEAARAPELTASADGAARQGVAQPAPRAETARVSRIEIQTADPNIRIIWLATAAGADDEPGAVDPDRVDPER